jgi:tripartite-type tricarboxylate transporter receptor subunit TctC
MARELLNQSREAKSPTIKSMGGYLMLNLRPFVKRIALLLSATCLVGGAAVAPTLAQDSYPERPIHMVVPFEPGGGSDLFARIVSEKLAVNIGQPVVIENRPGASTNIGARYVAEAEPDGYTLYFAAPNFTVNPSIFKSLPFDPVKDFQPVATLGAVAAVLTVHKSVQANTLQELIALAKSKPGQLNYATTGVGSGSSMAAELFRTMAGIDVVNIPYQGSSSAIKALIAGQVDFGMNSAVGVMQHIQAGSLRPLGVSTAQRSKILPDVPTIAEAGLPGYETKTWYGVLAPAGTPKPIVDKLNAELNKVMLDPDTGAKLAEQGVEPFTGTPEEFAAFIQSDIGKWQEVVAKAGIEKQD